MASGNKISAFVNFKDSWKVFKAYDIIMTKNPQSFSDNPKILNKIHFGIGLFHLLFSQIPQSFLKLFKLLGISPD